MKLLLLSAVLTLGLVGSALSTPAAMAAPGTTKVAIKNFVYNPASITVVVGETVEWVNEDSAQHNVTANDGSFKSPNLNQGNTFSHKFEKAGTYAYYCTFHRGMKGTVIVK
jgi:plastocyanin